MCMRFHVKLQINKPGKEEIAGEWVIFKWKLIYEYKPLIAQALFKKKKKSKTVYHIFTEILNVKLYVWSHEVIAGEILEINASHLAVFERTSLPSFHSLYLVYDR